MADELAVAFERVTGILLEKNGRKNNDEANNS